METYIYNLNLKVTRSQKDLLKRSAAKAGMRVSEFHRKVLFDSIDLSPDAKMALHLQMAGREFIRRLYACYFGGVDITPDLFRQMEADVDKEAPKMLEDFIASQRAAA